MKKSKNFLVLRIGLYRVMGKKTYNLIEKLGYYKVHFKHKILSLRTERLGFWLNKGARLNFNVYKLLKFFLPKSKSFPFGSITALRDNPHQS